MRWLMTVLGWGLALVLSAGLMGCPVESRTELCTVDQQCPAGKGCVGDVCKPVECRIASDCSGGRICRDHACVVEVVCQSDGDCDPDQVCRNNVCVEEDDCQSDGDCDPGQLCRNNVCVVDSGCQEDGDCNADQVCEAGSCRPGCRSDAGCAPGVCDPVGRVCVDCLLSDDCELGELCVAGTCVTGCEIDRDCPPDLSCFANEPPHGVCGECSVDGDCTNGERCQDHICYVPCTGDPDCPAGEICEGGGCRVGCRGALDCPGAFCDPGSWSCVECLTLDDCELGQLCIDGACTPGCKVDRDCPANLICDENEPPHGQCVECVDPEDCPGDGPRACLEPLGLDFGSVPPGQTASLSFAIESCGQADLTLLSLSLGPGSSTSFSLANLPVIPAVLTVGESLVVQVQYGPAQAGDHSGGVDIYSDDPTADPATGLTGTVALVGRSDDNYCDLEVSPAAVDFGLIQVGQSAQVALTLENLGNETCVVDQVAIGQNSPYDEFGLQGVTPGTSITPGGSLSVTVTYDPSDPGHDTGRLDILSNDKDSAVTAVNLEGFGQPAGDGPVAVCTVTPGVGPTMGNLTWHGDQSFDPAQQILQWNWSQVSFPAGSTAALGLALGPTDRITDTDLAGFYSAQLVVTNDLGMTSQPCTATAEVVPDQDLWIELYWQVENDDMDLHLLAPGGIPRSDSDCYFANCHGIGDLDWGQDGDPENNPSLPVDNVPGLGPEIIYLPSPDAGEYTVFVHDYPGTVYNGANQVTVNLWIRGNKVSTFEKVISGEDLDTDICRVEFPSGIITPL